MERARTRLYFKTVHSTGALNKTLNIPGPKPLPGTNTPVEHVIVGDGAFGISNKILKPYARSNMNPQEKNI